MWPFIEQTHPDKFQLIFRQQVQPWHASSTIVHEAAIAVEKVDNKKFFDYSDVLFEHQREYVIFFSYLFWVLLTKVYYLIVTLMKL